MKGLDGRPEPQSGAARKAGGILARSKWQGEGFGDVTVTPREALGRHPHGPSVAGMARPGPRLSKLQGFPISASGSPRLHWPAIGFTHSSVPVRRIVWGCGGVEWDGYKKEV